SPLRAGRGTAASAAPRTGTPSTRAGGRGRARRARSRTGPASPLAALAFDARGPGDAALEQGEELGLLVARGLVAQGRVEDAPAARAARPGDGVVVAHRELARPAQEPGQAHERRVGLLVDAQQHMGAARAGILPERVPLLVVRPGFGETARRGMAAVL